MKAILQKSIGNDSWREQLPDFVSAPSTRLFRDMTEADPDGRIADYDDLIARIDELLLPSDETISLTRAMRPKAAKGFAGLRIPMLVRALGMLAIAAAVGYLLWQSTLVAPPLVQGSWTVSYTHLTLPTICSV